MKDSPPDFPIDELDTLLAASLDDDLSSEKKERLNTILRNSADARRYASQALLDESILHFELRATETGKLLGADLPISTVDYGSPHKIKGSRVSRIWALAASLALLLGLSMWFRQPFTQSTSPTVQSPEIAEPQAIASLIRSFDSVFSDTQSPSNGLLNEGTYKLEQGAAEFQFRTGVLMVVNSPAEFTIKNEALVVLSEGTVRARVPKQAIGFTIEAPDVNVVDLGTEFGVSVGGPNKNTEVHVFSGEVELHEENGSSPRIVKEGFVGEWVNNTSSSSFGSPDDKAFPTLQDLTFNDWKKSRDAILSDPGIIAYYDFRPDSSNSRTLVNRANPGKMDGKIHGASWVQGRWSKSGALQFENPKDRVSLNLPRALPQATFSAWIKVDRFDYSINALLNTNSYGQIANMQHFQILNDGALRVSGAEGEGRGHSTSAENTVQTGVWVHVAFSFDVNKSHTTYYANGKAVLNANNSNSAPLFLGPSCIGHWARPRGWARTRDFRGRIDELFILNRAMSDSEIREIYEAGNPATW